MSKKGRRNNHSPAEDFDLMVDDFKLEPKSINQSYFIQSIENYTVTIAIGPSGCGKTFVGALKAAELLDAGKCDQIVVTRPAKETKDESLGFMPGDLQEKYEPYIQPVRDVFEMKWGREGFEDKIKHRRIVPIPVAFIRGRSFDRTIILFDEAQNSTPEQMEAVLTRIGKFSKVVVNGDNDQPDIKGNNGLLESVKALGHLRGVNTVLLEPEDIERSGIVKDIVQAYDDYRGRNREELIRICNNYLNVS